MPVRKQSRKQTTNHQLATVAHEHQTTLWKTVTHHYTTAVDYNRKGEWLAGYYNLQLATLACKHYISACGLDPVVVPTNQLPSAHTLKTIPPLDATHPARTLRMLYLILPLYLKKIYKFQRAFGCPRAPSSANATPEGTTDCSAITSIDLSKDDSPVYFDDIVGNDRVKEAIEDGMMNPMFMPMLYPNQARAMLFYGPPGTGKTLLARATAFELNRREALRVLFFAPTADQFKGKFVGETEANIVQLFRCASKQATDEQAVLHAQHKTHIQVKSVIFIDEVDSLARRRDGQTGASAGVVASATNTLLQVMDGIQSYNNVIVLAATNYPWNIDSAVLRRFSQKIYVPLPTEDDIVLLLQQSVVQQVKRSLQITHETHKRPIKEQFFRWQLLHGIQEKQLRVLASEMVGSTKDVGYSPRDLVRLCDSVYKSEASNALYTGTFHRITPTPTRQEHTNHSQTLEDILQSLKHTHVSTATFERLCAYMPHAIDTDAPPVTSDASTFPYTITRILVADPSNTTVYTERSMLPKDCNIASIDAQITRTMHLYVNSEQTPPSDILLHRTFKVHARHQTHYVPFFLLGTLPANTTRILKHIHRAVFVYDGRVYHIHRPRNQPVALHESVWLSPQQHPIVIDTSTTWLRQCVQSLTAFAPASPRPTPDTTEKKRPTDTPPSSVSPTVTTVAKLLVQHLVKITTGASVQDITTIERYEYDTQCPTSATQTEHLMQCVHTSYDIQSFVNAFGDVLPSAKQVNVRALDTYQRTGKEP